MEYKPQAAVTQWWTISSLLPITDYLGQRNGKPQRHRFARFAKNHVESIWEQGACMKVWLQTISIFIIYRELSRHAHAHTHTLLSYFHLLNFGFSSCLWAYKYVGMPNGNTHPFGEQTEWHSNIEPYCHHFCNIGIWFVFIFHTFALLLSLASTRCD